MSFVIIKTRFAAEHGAAAAKNDAMRTVLDVQFFQCVGEGRAVSWYRRRGALDHRVIAGEGPAARAAEAGRAVAEALHEGDWGACFCFFCGWWGRVGHCFAAAVASCS